MQTFRYRILFFLLSFFICANCAAAADSTASLKKYMPEVHATLRARYEISTADGDGRFQVRNARVNLKGNIADFLGYYFQADFCDRGSFRMLDAYAIFSPSKHVRIMAGQMRVPLSVDASRSVHTYWFANRSLSNRDMWSSRRVGLKARYSFALLNAPAFVEGGIFNSASTSSQTGWSDSYTYAVIGAATFGSWTPEIGFQSKDTGNTRVNLWNASLTWKYGLWEAEGEFLYKIYSSDAAVSTKAFNIMARRFFPIKCPYADRVSLDMRFDGTSDNCDGERDDAGELLVTQTSRMRLTAGTTLAYLRGPVQAHLRLNYEQYFHDKSHVYSTSDSNRLCLELMLHF